MTRQYLKQICPDYFVCAGLHSAANMIRRAAFPSLFLLFSVALLLPAAWAEDSDALLKYKDRLDGSDMQVAEEAANAVELWLETASPYQVQLRWELSEYDAYYKQRQPLLYVAGNAIRILCQQNKTEYNDRAFSLYKKTIEWLGDGPIERGIRVELARGFFTTHQQIEWAAEHIWPTLAYPEELFLPDSVLGQSEPAYYYDEENGASFYEQQNSHFVYLKMARLLVDTLLRNGKVEMARAMVAGMKDWQGTHAVQMRESLTQQVKQAEN